VGGQEEFMSKPLQLIMLSTTSGEPEAFELQLKQAGYACHCRRVASEKDFLHSLHQPADLILAGTAARGLTALRALEILQERGLDIPLIVIGAAGTEEIVSCLKAGAADYLDGGDLERLGAAAARALEDRTLREVNRKIALELTSTLNRDEVMEHILSQLKEVVDYDRASFQLLEADRLRIVGVRGFPEPGEVLDASFPVNADHPAGEVLRGLDAVIVDDAPAKYRELRPGRAETAPIRSWLGVPLMAGGRLIGTLSLEKREPAFYSREHAHLALSLAASAAVTIENMRLFEEAQRRVAELEALQQTSLQMTSSLNLSDVLGSIAENSLKLVGATDCHIYLYDAAQESFSFGAALWKNGRRQPAVRKPRSQGFTANVARQGRALVINDVESHPLYSSIQAKKWHLKAIAGFPLKRAEQVLGVFTIAFLDSHTFSEAELRVLGLLADQAAVAIENARLFMGMRRERDYSQALITMANALVVGLDLEGRVRMINNYVEEMTGYSFEELKGKVLFKQLFPHEEQQEAHLALRELFAHGKHGQHENQIRTKNGRERVISWSGTLIRDDQGRPESVFVVGQDITEQKQLEIHLRQTQKMEAIGQLAGGIAHDFNNLLTPIRGSVDMLMEIANRDEQQMEYLQSIKLASERAAGLTRQLRLFTRQDEGQRQPLDLNKIVRETSDLLGSSLARHIAVKLDLEDELWAVGADSSQISQVLINLSLNAQDSMEQGGTLQISTRNISLGETEARLSPEVRPGRYACLSVEDSGCGMSPETEARIFEPFFTTKKPGKGTGLGLSVVYGIVRAHGGFIEVQTEPGKGSRFDVYLRTTELAVAEMEREDAALPAGNETILLVDDEEMIRRLGRRVLEKCGYTVLIASNGAEAVAVYKEQGEAIDLVLLDVIMPRMNGQECLRRLQQLDPKVRVLIATGYTADSSVQRLKAEGVLGVVEKPFSVRTLAAAVRTALDNG
jgi:PAS domain S-box-containing protein